MKRLLLFVCTVFGVISIQAQIPNFGTTVGNQKLYGYTSMKCRPNSNVWETYSTLQYGITDYVQIGADLYTGLNSGYVGYVIRTGYKFSDYFKLGAQITPSFDLNNNHSFGYLTSALYMNGQITKDGKFFWVSDTWIESTGSTLSSAKQWTYLGYTANCGKNSITPMLGVINSWKFDQPIDLSFGAYYTFRNINFYLWTNDILTSNPRFIIGAEFSFLNK